VSESARLLITAVACLVATAALGAYVSHRPLTPLDAASEHLRGHGTRLAVMFTRAGYWPVLTGLTGVLAAVELIDRGGILFTLLLTATQLLSQWVSDAAKAVSQRVRPEDWLFRHEAGFSFPSGHATTAVVFFGGVLYFIWSLPLTLPLHVALGIVTAAFVIGIPWSRMALSAHYATDVLGGLLSGGAWLCIMVAVLLHLHVSD
jgi:membrane-associated phospholipid phosphatase